MSTLVLGLQFGDEGKGKIVDCLTPRHDVIMRFNGGNNAGHTLVVNGKKTITHILPSGILHSDKLNVIGNGCVIDPQVFFQELESLGLSDAEASKRIKVSGNCHVIMPYHIELDKLREKEYKLGTTCRGIGPCYEDKASRRGIRVADLWGRDNKLSHQLFLSLSEKNILFREKYYTEEYRFDSMLLLAIKYGERLQPFIYNDNNFLDEKNILFEGAQATMLDVDHSNQYPFVTSCITTLGSVYSGTGLHPKLDKIIGVFKPYRTYVGNNDFPTIADVTPQFAYVEELIRKKGHEYGSTTGRERQIGWLDIDQLKYAIKLNGINSLAMMKSDVLSGLDVIRVVLNGKYEPLGGWKSLSDDNFTKFMNLIESETQLKLDYVSSSPERIDFLRSV